MTEVPTFAVVGHPNKGKSSIVSTLMSPLYSKSDDAT